MRGLKGSLGAGIVRTAHLRASPAPLSSVPSLNGFPPGEQAVLSQARGRRAEKGADLQEAPNQTLHAHTCPWLAAAPPTKSTRPPTLPLPRRNNLRVRFPWQPEALPSFHTYNWTPRPAPNAAPLTQDSHQAPLLVTPRRRRLRLTDPLAVSF